MSEAMSVKAANRYWLLCRLMCCLMFSVPAWSQSDSISVWMEDLTWVELKARVDAGATSVILPAGGVEQNGPLIALGKHNWVVAYAAQEIATTLGNTLVAPVLKVVPQGDLAKPAGNLLFPGTLALREDTFERVLSDTVLSLAYAGFQNIYLLGDHGLSQPVQESVAKRMGEFLKAVNVRVWHVSAFYQPEMEATYLENQGVPKELQGDHAGVADTAQIMAVRPEAVRAKLAASVMKLSATEMGMSGSPEKATVKMGVELLRLRLDAALSQIRGLQ